MKNHSWSRVSFFRKVCLKCGCVKERQAEKWPPSVIYDSDGQIFLHAPECSERFIDKQIDMVFEKVDIF